MTREELLALFQTTADQALKPREVTVKGWGKLHVRALTVAEVDEQDVEVDKNDKASLARGAARLLCDENGKRLLDPDNEADVKMLSGQSWAMLRQLLAASEEDIKGEPTEKK